jgi:hypothetical protein
MGVLAGGFLRCMECGRVREITKEWVEELCKHHFLDRAPFALYDTDIRRFRCSKCDSKQIKYFASEVPQHEKVGSKEIHPHLDIQSGVQRGYSPMHGHYGRGIRDEWKDK